MAEELKIKETKQVVANGLVQYSQEVVELAKQGYVLDIRNKTSPNFMLGLFTCNMLLLEDETSIQLGGGEVGIAEEATAVEQPKPRKTCLHKKW